MRKIIDCDEIKEKGIKYCQMQHKRGKERRFGSCKTCPLHICIDHNGLIHVSVMDFSDFVENYNLMISELSKMTKEGSR